MALVKCKECGEQVSTKAKACPSCGAKAPKRTSLFTWLVLVVVIVGAWGTVFNGGTSSRSTSSYSSTPPSARPTTTAAASSSTPAQPATPKPAWEYRVNKDELTGEETGFLVAYSRNALDGWLRDSKAVMGYTCGQGFYVRANDVGFATDDLNCSQYSCTRDQYARVRFDDGPTKDVRFDVWDDNNDGMSLIKQSPTENVERFFMNSMKAGQTMFLELETFNTNGRQQVAEFGLTGFTAAINSCP